VSLESPPFEHQALQIAKKVEVVAACKHLPSV
jgi:hypothetical protein